MGRLNNKKGKKAPFLKAAAPSAPPNPEDFPPAFSFEKMQDTSGNSFNCCEDDDRLYLAKRMFMLSRMPWKQIRAGRREGLGSEEIPRSHIKHGIPASVTEDVETFHSLHYVAHKRFVGYRVGQIFYILWVDHNFGVYDHG